jgi:hypothetical protein
VNELVLDLIHLHAEASTLCLSTLRSHQPLSFQGHSSAYIPHFSAVISGQFLAI